jgi:hypothetical protein
MVAAVPAKFLREIVFMGSLPLRASGAGGPIHYAPNDHALLRLVFHTPLLQTHHSARSARSCSNFQYAFKGE